MSCTTKVRSAMSLMTESKISGTFVRSRSFFRPLTAAPPAPATAIQLAVTERGSMDSGVF